MGLIIAGTWKNGDRLCKLKDATVRVCVCERLENKGTVHPIIKMLSLLLTPPPWPPTACQWKAWWSLHSFLKPKSTSHRVCANTFSFSATVKISRIALLWSSRNHSTLWIVLKDKSHILCITAVSKHIVEFIIFQCVFNYFPDQHWFALISIQYENQLADSWSCIIHHSKHQVCIIYDNDKILL